MHIGHATCHYTCHYTCHSTCDFYLCLYLPILGTIPSQDLYQPGLPWARSRRAVNAANTVRGGCEPTLSPSPTFDPEAGPAPNQVIAANKADVPGAAERLDELRAQVTLMVAEGELPEIMPAEEGGSLVTAVSAKHGKNLSRLLRRVHLAVSAARGQREQAEGQALVAAQEAARRAAEDDEYEFYEEDG